MTSETRRQSTDELLALIDDVVSGHENQHSYEYGVPVSDLVGCPGSLRAYIDEQLTAEYHRQFEIETQRLIVGEGTGEPTGERVSAPSIVCPVCGSPCSMSFALYDRGHPFVCRHGEGQF